MAHTYPYPSTLRRELAAQRPGEHYVLWQEETFDAQKELAEVGGELLELGGPTFDGFYFLENIPLPRAVTISNLNDTPFADEAMRAKARPHITAYIDAAQIPYDKDSVGMVLVHHLSIATDEAPHDRSAHESDRWRHAETEMSQVILGLRKPEEAVLALRIRMMREAYRVLKPGGLLITDGLLAELEIMNRIGFVPKVLVVDKLTIQEIVLQKPKVPKA